MFKKEKGEITNKQTNKQKAKTKNVKKIRKHL